MLPSRALDHRFNELAVLEDADRRARDYVARIGSRSVYPTLAARRALDRFEEELTASGLDEASTIEMLDELGSAAAVESNGGRYFGYVVGATLPVAAAADRLALAWDNSASTSIGSPATAAIEAAGPSTAASCPAAPHRVLRHSGDEHVRILVSEGFSLGASIDGLRMLSP